MKKVKAHLPFALPGLLTAAAFLVVSCDEVSSITSGGSPDPEDLYRVSDYPIKRMLTDQGGRPLDGGIVARSEDSLYVIRYADGMNFEIPIRTLSKEDQEFTKRLPEIEPSPEFAHGTASQVLDPKDIPASKRKEPAYIQTRLDAIKRLEESNEILLSEALSTSNSMLKKARHTQLEKNRKEIQDLKAAIDLYRKEQKR